MKNNGINLMRLGSLNFYIHKLNQYSLYNYTYLKYKTKLLWKQSSNYLHVRSQVGYLEKDQRRIIFIKPTKR